MYIAASYHKFRDEVTVWERTVHGRIARKYNPSYYYYSPAKDGKYTSITNVKLEKLEFDTQSEFNTSLLGKESWETFESDFSQLERCLMDNYVGKPPAILNIGFLDIEVDYDPTIGFAGPLNPYAIINAVTIYFDGNCSDKKPITLAVPPSADIVFPQDMLDDNYILCTNERELLSRLLQLIEDLDIISGWNSDFYDLPYIGKRVEMLFGEMGMKRLAFPEGPLPRWSEQLKYKGSMDKDLILDLQSRVHLDYMRLFKKFNLGGRKSYSLANIAAEELDIPKLTYDGSLADLYHGTWLPKAGSSIPENCIDQELYELQLTLANMSNITDPDSEDMAMLSALDLAIRQRCFENFCKYNRRDSEILKSLNNKFKYIELANNMVHEATVNFSSVFGSVQLIDSAIINFAHTKLNKILFNKTRRPGEGVEGALVLSPLMGLHRWVASCDINSLYPSTYRSLNLSPEKIVGQLLEREDGWRAVYTALKNPNKPELKDVRVTFIPNIFGHTEDDLDSYVEMSVGELIRSLKDNKYAISAYGTILDQGNGEGLIPGVLSYWFTGRKELQAEKKKYGKLAREYLKNGGLKDDAEYIKLKTQEEYFDMLQGVRKVLLNSAYGATLNEFCRFHDPRLGASTTGSGRQITTFMIETITEQLLGEHRSLKKTVTVNNKGEVENEYTIDCPEKIGPVMSDTDSCYFIMDSILADTPEDEKVEMAIALADGIVNYVNDSFSDFMKSAFLCQDEFSDKIKAVREMVARVGIIRAKKNYTFFSVDNEGVRTNGIDDPKAIKLQGGDLKVSSTPETVREFLDKLTRLILTEADRDTIDNFVMDFRSSFKSTGVENPLEYASASSVKTYNDTVAKLADWNSNGCKGKRPHVSGQVQASINYNECLTTFNAKDPEITSGAKVKVLWLKKNDYGYASMAFPSETEELPEWFLERFVVDSVATEGKMIDQKVSNTFEPIGWQVPTNRSMIAKSLLDFG